jgi:hypothetical protein
VWCEFVCIRSLIAEAIVILEANNTHGKCRSSSLCGKAICQRINKIQDIGIWGNGIDARSWTSCFLSVLMIRPNSSFIFTTHQLFPPVIYMIVGLFLRLNHFRVANRKPSPSTGISMKSKPKSILRIPTIRLDQFLIVTDQTQNIISHFNEDCP